MARLKRNCHKAHYGSPRSTSFEVISKKIRSRAGLRPLPLFFYFATGAFVAYDPILSRQTMSFFLQLQKWDSSF
jgi:hypothetical protein